MSGVDAYRKSQAVQGSPRQTEADILLRVAREIEAAKTKSQAEMNEALMRNISLWQLLAFDCADENNQLPQALRAQIISLAIWAVRHSDQAMFGEASPDALIDVNRTIARGLMAAQENAAAAAGAEPGGATTAVG